MTIKENMKKNTLFITRNQDGKFRVIPCNDYQEIDKSLLKRMVEPSHNTPAMFITSNEVSLMKKALSIQEPQNT